MSEFNRRRFLQSASLAVAGTAMYRSLGSTVHAAPVFAETPTFNPRALFLTWQRDPTTTMTIQWVGDNEDDGTKRPVWYSKRSSQLWRKQEHAARPYPDSDSWIFRAELSGLEPGADYVFRIGSDSAEQRFRTMPGKDTNVLQFVSGGDCGLGPAPRATNRLAGVQAPQFVVLGGDLAYENGRDGDAFLQFLENYSRDVRDDQQRLIPMLACIGNHEVDGGYEKPRDKAPFFYSMFDGLFRDTSYAALDFGQYMSLVFLDTNHTSPIGGAQADWLDGALKERQDCPNLFVFNHVPAYPSHRDFTGEDAEEGTGAQNRIHWAPLFERYRVDAVFEHHDHTFKRTHPLLDGRPNEKGILYLGDGSWGKIRRPQKLDTKPYLAVTHESFHLSVHRIEGPQRFHVALSDNGRVVDVCTTTKQGGTRRG
jgi:hypothetical protein